MTDQTPAGVALKLLDKIKDHARKTGAAWLAADAEQIADALRTPASGAVEAAAWIIHFPGMDQVTQDRVLVETAANMGHRSTALAALTSSPKAEADCFECAAPLVGPFCPECNPAIKQALGYAVETPQPLQGGEVTREAALREVSDFLSEVVAENILHDGFDIDNYDPQNVPEGAVSRAWLSDLGRKAKMLRTKVNAALISPARREGEPK